MSAGTSTNARRGVSPVRKPTVAPRKKPGGVPKLPPPRPRRKLPDPRPKPPVKRPKPKPKNPKWPTRDPKRKPWTPPKDPLDKVPRGKGWWKKTPFNWKKAFGRGAGIAGAGAWIYTVWPSELKGLREAGWSLCCAQPGRLDVYFLNNQLNTGGCGNPPMGLCGTGGQPFNGPWPVAIPAPSPNGDLGGVLHIGQIDANPLRATWKQTWMRPSHPAAQPDYPGVPLEPAIRGWPWPLWPGLPDWYIPKTPLEPDGPPFGKPDVRPRPRPRPKPKPKPKPRPDGAVKDVPVLEVTPDGVTVTNHERKPPGKHEREKKTQPLPKKYANQWMKILGFAGKITEFDDLVSALYNGLPSSLTRWRGRDGVWRQRDATTADRVQRLFDYVGRVDMKKAIDFAVKAAGEVAKNELEDLALGKLGRLQAQAGRTFNASRSHAISKMTGFDKNSWEIRKAHEKAEFQKWWKGGAKVAAPLSHGRGFQARWYWATKVNKDGELSYVWTERPKTQIPWYRQTQKIGDRTYTRYSASRGY